MSNSKVLNLLMAVMLSSALLILEAIAYKLKYDLTLISNDPFVYTLFGIQIWIIYFTLVKLKFNSSLRGKNGYYDI